MYVIKYGGNALPDLAQGEIDQVLEAIADEYLEGEQIVLVHGGGPFIDKALADQKIESKKISGYRVTSKPAFEVVQSVLSGTILRTIVNYLIGSDVNAVGLSASDGNLIRAKKFEPVIDGKRADLGFVGEVESCNPAILESLITEGYLPVVSPIAADLDGVGFNVNADQVAAAIAGAMKADTMLFLTDVDGIYRDFSDQSSLLTKTNLRELASLKIADGMIPKVAAISAAIKAGAQSVRVCNGTKIDAVLDAFAGEGGTLVTA
jgi:acetylglutamate kinase